MLLKSYLGSEELEGAIFRPPSNRSQHLIQVGAMLTIALALGSCTAPKSSSPATEPSVTPSPVVKTNENNNSSVVVAKYFDGSKACKFLFDVSGLDLGTYVPYTNTEGYSCEGGERVVKLSCNPSSDMLCNEISYAVDGEKEGATSVELSYMGTSLYSGAHKKDMQTFVRYATQLSERAVGVEIDSQIRQYLLATNQFLPMKPQANPATIEQHTLKKKLGTGFVKILTRRNDLPGGTAYIIFFTIVPDERWSNR